MKWPWVSRKTLERVEKQLQEVDAERRSLLNLLLERNSASAAPAPVSVEEDRAHSPAFTTPFDKVIGDFDRAGRKARDPKFKARMR